jgi:hypothetical protein
MQIHCSESTQMLNGLSCLSAWSDKSYSKGGWQTDIGAPAMARKGNCTQGANKGALEHDKINMKVGWEA